MSLLKKVEALHSELEQKNQEIALKNGELREKSERISNLRDKMDSLEVDLGIQRHSTSSANEDLICKTEELEEKLEELEISRDQIAELEELINELKESTELDQETLQKVYCEEISQRDVKLQEQGREIESLKKELAEKTDMIKSGLTQRLDAKNRESSKFKWSPVVVGEKSRKRDLKKIRKLKKKLKRKDKLLKDWISRDSTNSDTEVRKVI